MYNHSSARAGLNNLHSFPGSMLRVGDVTKRTGRPVESVESLNDKGVDFHANSAPMGR